MEPDTETSTESRVEVVGVPGYPVHPVEDVGIGIVPCPVDKLNANDIIGKIDQGICQTS